MDTDGDGVRDSSDNCTLVANTKQQDTDSVTVTETFVILTSTMMES